MVREGVPVGQEQEHQPFPQNILPLALAHSDTSELVGLPDSFLEQMDVDGQEQAHHPFPQYIAPLALWHSVTSEAKGLPDNVL